MNPADVFGPLQLEALRQLVREELAARASAPEGYIGTAEAARRAGVKPETIVAWIERGLPATKAPGGKEWRIRPRDLERFMSGEFEAEQEAQREVRTTRLVNAVRRGGK